MNCKEGATQLIDQIVETIQLIQESDFSRSMPVFNGSTLGKHFRHIFDFFICLVDQCNCSELDYARRKRDPLIETNKEHAIQSFRTVQKAISQLDEGENITVYADFELSDGSKPSVTSSIGRELMYAYDHAVHHLAIVKIGLKTLDPEFPIDDHLGVAASTVRHQFELTHGH